MGNKFDVQSLITKKRTTKDEKNKAFTEIREKALKLIEQDGKFVKINNIPTKPKEVSIKSLTIMLSTPFNKLPGAEDQYILDIWQKGAGKFFSARWNPMAITTFKRTEWLYELGFPP